MTLPLFQYQKEVVEKILTTGTNYFISAFPGAGKTGMAITVADSFLFPVLFVTKAGILEQWRIDWHKFTDKPLPAFVSAETKKKDRLNIFFSGRDVVTTYETIVSLFSEMVAPEMDAVKEKLWKEHLAGFGPDFKKAVAELTRRVNIEQDYGLMALLKKIKKAVVDAKKKIEKDVAPKFRHFEAVFFDESHMIMSHKAIRTQTATAVAWQIQRRFCMTGTPAGNRYIGIWSQYNAIKPLLLGRFHEFGNRYFKQDRYFNYHPLKDTVQRIAPIIAPYTITLIQSECQDLPEISKLVYTFDATTEQARIYRELKAKFKAEVAGGIVEANNTAAALMGKLHQVACGFIYEGKGEERIVHRIPNNKIEALESIIEDSEGQRVVVWHYFQESGKMLEEWKKKREAAGNLTFASGWVDFHDGESQVYLAQAADTEGVQLSKASVVIFFDTQFAQITHIQRVCRTWRTGQKRTVAVYQLLCHLPGKKMIDQYIYDTLLEKIDFSEKATVGVNEAEKIIMRQLAAD